MTRPRRPVVNPIFVELGRAVVAILRDSSPTEPADWQRKEWLALALSAHSTRAGAYFDNPPVLIDPHSHKTHAMNPIDRKRYAAEEREPPPERHFFRCMFCGAFDFTKRAAAPCPHGAP